MNPKIPIKSNLMYKIFLIWRPYNFGASGRGPSGPALGTALVGSPIPTNIANHYSIRLRIKNRVTN